MLAGVTPGQGALYAIGAASELLGIGLVAAPDLVPGARRFSRWLGPRWRTIENRLRRRLHLPLRSITHSVEMTGTVGASGSLSAVVSIGTAATTLEEQVAFLLRRNEEAQKEVNAVVERVAAIEQDLPRRLDELREGFETRLESELAAALTEYRPARIIGAGLVALGLGLATAGNFLG